MGYLAVYMEPSGVGKIPFGTLNHPDIRCQCDHCMLPDYPSKEFQVSSIQEILFSPRREIYCFSTGTAPSIYKHRNTNPFRDLV